MQRRDLLNGGAVLVAAFMTGVGNGDARTSPIQPDDERFMRLAIAEAAKAEFPFGAVVVRRGEVVARGHNRTGIDRDPTAHGEMVAIRTCLASHGPDALKGATLYTSGEPCCMCMGAILWCGIGRLVYATSLQQLAPKIDQIMLSADEIAARAPFAPVEITGGVLDGDALRLFK